MKALRAVDRATPRKKVVVVRTFGVSLAALKRWLKRRREGEEYLNAWCELSLEDLSGRCPRTRVGLLTNPEGKGTDSSWLTWTPSSPHFTSWSTIFASLIEPYEADPVLMPP